LPFVTKTRIRKGDNYSSAPPYFTGTHELTSDSRDGERRLLAGDGDREREPEYERGIVVISEQVV